MDIFEYVQSCTCTSPASLDLEIFILTIKCVRAFVCLCTQNTNPFAVSITVTVYSISVDVTTRCILRKTVYCTLSHDGYIHVLHDLKYTQQFINIFDQLTTESGTDRHIKYTLIIWCDYIKKVSISCYLHRNLLQDMAMWRQYGDHSLFKSGSCVQKQTSL